MSRIWVAAFLVIGLGFACASEAGVITSIQRLDTDDVTPNFNESLILQGLTPGAQVYSDTTFTYGALPSYLQGADYIKMVNGDQSDSNYRLQLNLNQMATIYLMVDDRFGQSSWMKALGFTDTGDNILLADVTTSIYRGTFSTSQIVLQDQFVIEGGPFRMYTVAAAQPTGDIVLTQSTTTGTATINTLTLQATNNVVNLTQNAGTTLTLTQGSITKNGTFGGSISGGLLATPSGAFNVTTNAGLLTIGSALTGPSNKLNVLGAGTLELTSIDPNQNFNAGIFVTGGTLRFSDVRNLGGTAANPNALNLNNGALEMVSGAAVLSNLVNINFGGGTLRPINTTALLTLPNNNQIQGFGAFTKDGAGGLIIGGSNAFQGPVTVSGGMLELRDPGAFGGTTPVKSPITLAGGTTLNLHSDAAALPYNNAITLSGLGTINVGRIAAPAGGDFFLTSLSLPADPAGNPTTLMVTNTSADNSALHFSSQVNLGNNLIVNTASSLAYFEAALQGTGGLTKTGTGTLFLTGAVDNSFPITTILQGTLALGKNPGNAAISADSFINGGTMRFDASNQIANAASVNLMQGLFNLNGKQDTFNALTVTGGNVSTGAGLLTLLAPPGGAAVPGSPSGSGPVAASPIPGLFISGGVTTINPGGEINATTVQISGGVNTVQSAAGVLTVGSGGLTLAGDLSPNVTFLADASAPGRMSLNGNVNFTGLSGTASLDTSGVGAQQGRVDLNGVERTFTVNDGAGAVDMRISAAIVNGALKKSGAGTLRLSGNSTFAGGTTISAGTLELASSGALGTGGLTLNAGQLNLRADAPLTFTNALTFAGDATMNVDRDTAGGGTSGIDQFSGGLSIGASQLTLTGANRSFKFMGTTTLTGSATFNAPAVDVAFSSTMAQSGGTWGITKVGAGKVTLDGAVANTYGGTTRVNLGTLELNKTPGVNAVPAGLDIFGGTVRLLASNQIADTSAVTVNNAGSTLDLNGNSETIASLNGTGGVVTLGSGGALTVTQGTYNGVISGSGMVIQDNPLGGTGASLTLVNPQTFTGGVIVNHGSVNFSAQAPGHSGTTLLAGGTWRAFNGSSINFNAGSNILTNQADIVLDGASSSFAKINSLSLNQGSMTVSGGKTFTAAGALTNSGTMTVGVGSTLTANSGFTNSGTTTANGTFAAGGTIGTSGALTLNGPIQFNPGSTLNVTAGTTALNSDAGAPLNYKLAANVSAGGSLQVGATQHLANLVVSGSAAVGGASPPVTGNKVLVTQALSTPGSGTLDLNNNALVVDYTSGGSATFNAVQNEIRSGYHASGILWTGAGITSSTARLSTRYGIGYDEASDLLGPSGGTFQGESVDGTAVLARFTFYGDVNLDGSVDFLDLAKLAQSYNVIDGSRSWATGDVNYDGNTDFLDLALLAQNYNTALGAPVVPGAPADFNADVARAFAEVPEPTSFAVLAMAAAGGLLCWRGRKSHAA